MWFNPSSKYSLFGGKILRLWKLIHVCRLLYCKFKILSDSQDTFNLKCINFRDIHVYTEKSGFDF